MYLQIYPIKVVLTLRHPVPRYSINSICVQKILLIHEKECV